MLQRQCTASNVLVYEPTHFAGRALQYRLRNVLPADLSSRRAPFVAWSRQSLILTLIGASLCLAVIFGTNSGKSRALQAQDLQACHQEKEARVGIPSQANLCSDACRQYKSACSTAQVVVAMQSTLLEALTLKHESAIREHRNIEDSRSALKVLILSIFLQLSFALL